MRTFTKFPRDELRFKGWNNLIIWYFDKMQKYINENNIEGFQVTYMKEKYGGLRLEWQGADDTLFKMCTDLEDDSESTCSVCGKKGKIRTYMFWFTCLCWRHNIIRRLQWLYKKLRP